MWINLVCGGIVGIMVLVTAFMIARLEMIRKTAQAKTKHAKIIALIGAVIWLLIFFFFNAGWQDGQFFDRLSIFTALLLVIPYVGFLRLWLCLRLDKNGKTIFPSIVALQKYENFDGPDQWYATYEYLGEFKGKRKVYPTEQTLAAQYAHTDETAEEADGAIAVGLPNANVRYLENHPNIHRFEYDETGSNIVRHQAQVGIHEKGFLLNNWKKIILVMVAAFFLTVGIIGAQTYLNRNDLIVNAAEGWTNTELALKKGQCVRLEPYGTVRISETEGYNGAIDAVGWSVMCNPNDAGACMKNDAPYGALIARFGNGETFLLDQSMDVFVTDSGPLWLAVNDNRDNFGDNDGYFRVKVQVLDKPCE